MTGAMKAAAAALLALLAAPVVAAALIGLLAVAGYAVLVVLTFHEIHWPLRAALGLEAEETPT